MSPPDQAPNHITYSKEDVLRDCYGRAVIGVRISLCSSTGCNYRCLFCHNEGIYETSASSMKPFEVERIVKILNRIGVDYVKITGGEPLLRLDILEIIERISRLPLRDLSLTTNGTRLPQLAESLRKAGLKRVNISLHSLREERHNLITGVTQFSHTLAAIRAAIAANLTPVKLNMVILKGINDDEVEDAIRFAGNIGGEEKVILQLIELVREGDADSTFYNLFHADLSEIEEMLMKKALKETVRDMHFRHRYLQPNGVWVEVVKPMHNSSFCLGDNRIRITHDGKFKPCLLRHDNHVDFLQAMRRGASDDELTDLFKLAIKLREPFFKSAIKQQEPCLKPQST